MAGVAVHLDIVQIDRAAGLAIIGDEALRLVAGEIAVGVLVVVQEIAAALIPDGGRRRDLLAALEQQHRIAFGHVGLRAPIGVLPRDDALRPFRRIGAGRRALGMGVAA